MFQQLPFDANAQIYSFMNTRAIIDSLLINKRSKSLALTELEKRKEQVKDFNTGRMRVKQLCLEHSKLAIEGLTADASRSRSCKPYLLLVDDLREIACSHEQTAKFMVGCRNLYPRLDCWCLRDICMSYPDVAKQIFNNPDLRGKLQILQLKEIIVDNPDLFEVMLANEYFVNNRFHKKDFLDEIYALSEKFSFLIIKHPKLKQVIDVDQFARFSGVRSKDIAMYLLNESDINSKLESDTIMQLGTSHIDAAKCIVGDLVLCNKISESNLRHLQDLVIENVRQLTLRP